MYTIQPLTEQLLETYSQSYLETLAPLSPIGKHTIDSLQETLKIMQTQ
ncbi:MAG: hypothetical protein Q8O99_02285 [bacterium]|nr:hypothetical protein [bacterium]